jgi:hypothetical protein
MAKDIFHELTKNALIADGWTITDDPLMAPLGDRKLYIDLAAEKLLVADRQNQRIAVEVKSFIGKSTMTELEKAVGQYMLYRHSLTVQQSDRQLYLAIPTDVYKEFTQDKLIPIMQGSMGIKLLVYNPVSQTIVTWLS